jgi:glycosyltransferase involved in cell wall biosynthesis
MGGAAVNTSVATPRSEAAPQILLVNASEHVFGAEKSLAALAAALPPGAFRFTLAAPPGATQRFFERQGIAVRPLPLHRFLKRRSPAFQARQLWRWIRGSWLLYRLCRRVRPGLIHANGIQAMLYVPLAACLLRRPVVWHVRDLTFPRLLTPLFTRLASAVLVPSEATARGLPPGAKDKILIVPNPIGESLDSFLNHVSGPREPDSLAGYASDFKVGLVGQAIPRKGHDLLLDAVPGILARVPRARFFFIGSDPFDPRSAYVQAIREKIEHLGRHQGRVVWVDYTLEIDAIYRRLDLLVIPSRSEAFGRVALEAMAQGCPVAAARTGGLAEMIQDRRNGLLFPADDAAALARCVIELAGDAGLRATLSQAGHATAQSHRQSFPHAIDRVRACYERLILGAQPFARSIPAEGAPSSHDLG